MSRNFAIAFTLPHRKTEDGAVYFPLLGFRGPKGLIVQDDTEAEGYPTHAAAVKAAEGLRVPAGSVGIQIWEVVRV